MKLRARLAAAALLSALPAAVALYGVDLSGRHRAAESRLLGVVTTRLEQADRTACEADPALWSRESHRFDGPRFDGPRFDEPPHDRRPPFDDDDGPPPRPPWPPSGGGPHGPDLPRPALLFALDERFQAHDAPAVTASMQRDAASAGSAMAGGFGREVRVLVRTGWGGSCAYVLGVGSTSAGWGSILPNNVFWLLPSAMIAAAVILAMGPVVRRLRKLTELAQMPLAARSSVVDPGTDEIAELSRALATARDTARSELEANARREAALRDFLANTTHDLMIPLTVLQGHLADLCEVAGDAAVRAAMVEADYVGALLRNLSVAAKLEAADLVFEAHRVDLGALVDRVVARHRPIARAREIALESGRPGEPVWVRADVTLLEQAVGNLVHNAIRYNRAEGHVALTLDVGEHDFRLVVLDDGPGMSTSDKRRLLERGARGNEARTRAPEGQGLGLAITQRASALHGFGFDFESPEEGGLAAVLTGPLAPG